MPMVNEAPLTNDPKSGKTNEKQIGTWWWMVVVVGLGFSQSEMMLKNLAIAREVYAFKLV